MTKDIFIENLRKYKKQMYIIAFSVLQNHADTEDVVQDSILNAYRKIHTLRDDNKFGAWIMRIVVNQAKIHIRKNAKIIYIDDMQEKIDKPLTTDSNEIWELVMSLSNDLSTVVILHYWQGYTIKEISEIVGIPEGTVNSRLSRARKILRKELE